MKEIVTIKDDTIKAISTIERAASALVRRTAHDIESDVKAQMAAPKHGRTYTRRGKTHRASAKGEAPAIDTGAEANSITVANDGLFASVVGTADETAIYLEEGTATIDPRPAFKDAGKRAENTFRRNAQRIR